MGTAKKTTKKITTGAKAAKKASAPMEARVKAETKPAAKVEAVVAKPEVVAAPVMKFVPQHEVTALVREAAFLFAKRRNFRNGTPTQDWLAAEALVNERLTARGYTVSA